jgi:hypothetical protein
MYTGLLVLTTLPKQSNTQFLIGVRPKTDPAPPHNRRNPINPIGLGRKNPIRPTKTKDLPNCR